MTSQYRHRRTSNPATVFPNPLEPGEITVNTANRQIAVGDAASATLGTPKPLLAIRYFDTAAQYVVNEFVVNGTALYRSNKPTGPGAFVAADWVMMVGQIDPQYVAKTGDVMSGMLSLPAANPTAGVHATNKTYVDTLVASKSSVVVSDVKPTPDPIDSTLWYDTQDGQLYIRYNDGNSTAWVIAAPQPDAGMFIQRTGDTMSGPLVVVTPPTQPAHAASKAYVDGAIRYDGVQTLTAAQQTVARQNVYAAPFDALAYNGMQINGSMDVSQENGATTVNPGSNVKKYIVDGWYMIFSHSTAAIAGAEVQGPTISSTASFLNAINIGAVTAMSSVGASDFALVGQPIEGFRVARLGWGTAAAQPITVAFWINAAVTGHASLTLRNAVSNRSYVADFTVNSAATWEYKTITIPGDTTGTWVGDNGIGIQLQFFFAAGTGGRTTANVWTAGSFYTTPAQNNFFATNGNYVQLTGVVVLPGIEAPSAARSPLIMRPYDQELVTCKRYFYNGQPSLTGIAGGGANNMARARNTHPVTMRAAPTLTLITPLAVFDGGTIGLITSITVSYCTTTVLEMDALTNTAWTGGRSLSTYQGAGGNINVDARP